ncbi:hypothetical protein Y017_06500 [Alcanivorax sp. 97CO-5]|jgi:cell division protein FtsB|uniref:DUF6776 family protein n=1 Tax=unclassified Alcanivorax TaxID=2638842 RepID=UPI0003E7F37B|nr:MULTISPECIES: DUF6776 family protein [unclassified Alcanivorax]EUC67987.1 hypothetical protein Y017_06500 [Alcanivorax sp. 97CO-5]PKG00411.1 hypothetical protein Y019_13770 [Alcanivorax sp. 97CO-6]
MARKPKSRAGVDDVVLMPVSPSQQKKRRRFLVLVALFAGVLLFLIGGWLGAGGVMDASDSNRRLRGEAKILQAELDTARSQLAVFRADSELTLEAREEVRQEIKALQDQVAELEEAVLFYKNVMAPGGSEGGLQIEKMTLQHNSDTGEYLYRVVLVQSGDNRGYLSGDISLQLRGEKNGKAFIVAGSDWLEEGSETQFRFRYFQELNGRFKVPEGVAVQALDVDAESGGMSRYETQKTIKWQ